MTASEIRRQYADIYAINRNDQVPAPLVRSYTYKDRSPITQDGTSTGPTSKTGDIMLDVRFSERRETYRAPVVPNEIKGLVTFRNQSEHHPFLMWDVSEQGLGLWVAASLKPGEEVRVTIAQPFLLVMDCEVRWCRRRQDAPGYHIGLKVLENYKRLRGLIDYVSKHSEPDAR